MKTRALFMCIAVVTGGWCVCAAGVTNYVWLGSASPVPPYTSWATAATNIQDAVNAAVTGSVVLVTNGVYLLGGSTVASRPTRVVLPAGMNVNLLSVNGPECTVIDGGGIDRGAFVPSTARMAGFTVRNGYAITNILGGGIYMEAGGTVSNCIVENNHHVVPSATGLNLGGGGVYMNGASVIEYCIIRSNSTDYCGGGIALNTGGSIVRNCLLYGNNGFYGGAVYANRDCTMVNCTLAGNAATSGSGGGGITVNQPRFAFLYNNMIYGNTGGAAQWTTVFAVFASTGISFNCTAPTVGDHCETNAPWYVDAVNNNYRLTFGSPGMDAGTNLAGITRDMDGTSRPIDGTLDGTPLWDMGAYEFVPPTNTPGLAITFPTDLQVFHWSQSNTIVQGTGHDLLGWLAWTNEATHTAGTLVAGSPWIVNTIALAEGTNRWTISGTNFFGAATQAVVRIIRGGFGTPAITMLTTNGTLPAAVAYVIGSNNAHVVGTLVWTNVTDGRSGTLPVTPRWTATVPNLSTGDNTIVFIGTNLLGVVAQATAVITRTAITVRYVSWLGSSEPPFTNWATAATNLQTAVGISGDGDEVIVSAGTWYVTGPLTLTNAVVVRSVPRTTPMINANYSGRGVVMNHRAAMLDGFVIINGFLNTGQGYGAGVLCYAGYVQNCVVRDCYSYQGAAVCMVGGALQNCTVVTNRSFMFPSAGVRCEPGATTVNCIIRFNRPNGYAWENNCQNTGGTFMNCATDPAQGTDCITNDPKFINVNAKDFRLGAGSPCIEAGADLHIWTDHDIVGARRPHEGDLIAPPQFDMGAYELDPAPAVAITSAAMLVAYQYPDATLAGTANQFVAGMLWWSNATTAAQASWGPVQGPTNWANTGIAVTNGDNLIVVACSNAWGAVTSSTVVVHRETQGEAVPRFATNVLVFPVSGSVLVVGELTNIVWNPEGITDAIDGTNLMLASIAILEAATSNHVADASNGMSTVAAQCPWLVPHVLEAMGSNCVVRFDVVDSSGFTGTMIFADNAFTVVPEPAMVAAALAMMLAMRGIWSGATRRRFSAARYDTPS